MQDSNQTSSSDFLPGKPNMDGVLRGGVAMSPAAQGKPQGTKVSASSQATSAHVIDLKNASPSVVDSPLLNEGQEKVQETTPVGPVSVKVASPTENPKPTEDRLAEPEVQPDVVASTINPEPEKNVDELNLAKPEVQNVSAEASPATEKKGGKLKWILIIVGVLLVVAIAAGAVVYIISTTAV